MHWVSVISLLAFLHATCSLRPQTSETREIALLDGLWSFRVCGRDNPDEGFFNEWYLKSIKWMDGTILMPVPSSYNDITQDKKLRDHVGWVWYEREFFVASSWKVKRVVLRFDSVQYYAKVWLNGKEIMDHEGGHLPFESNVSNALDWSGPNRLTVAVNNTLTPFTLPCGKVVYPNDSNNYPPGYFRQELIFDFFNYAGIHRSVSLYSTSPTAYVERVRVTTDIEPQGQGMVSFAVSGVGIQDGTSTSCDIDIIDATGTVAASLKNTSSGRAEIKEPQLWWPIGSQGVKSGYQYVLKITLRGSEARVYDVYRQYFGIRTVAVDSRGLQINRKPFYFLGFGKHEDFHIFGRGFNLPVMVKDFNLMNWIGGNSFRTSHYPYAEEVLEYADQHGIVVIDESPAVGLHEFPKKTLEHHLRVMEEVIERDRNHPSVIMWSVANEPKSTDKDAREYFGRVINHTRALDPTRPVTFVIGGSNASLDKAASLADILCINHYFGWYSDPGHVELIQRQLSYDFRQWSSHFRKPIIITEYGADTIAGLHTSPSFIFSEEYQVEFMAAYHRAFDELRTHGILAGEMIWNFADFMTDQQINRVWGNRKGIFTRERQPKVAAHFLRGRYQNLRRVSAKGGVVLVGPEHVQYSYQNEI
ncbi:Beta-glucuronidase [Hypsibius exemplaris]|uniref:Beta-glucuronidase n=1 Tax=Hypsibius exemplaris TaxID=2072580 RepID=A0A1W0XAE2_HYPEX|nr:Beta-glucuronidase [Hypsibius exemplaris]